MATEGATVPVDSDLRSLCEEDTIRHNLVTFMPYIVDCIQVTDLLAYLHYYTNEQRKEIFQASGLNQQEATRKALNMLLDDFDDPGRFIAFREMAKERGYPKIERILSGTYIPDDENYRKIIDLFTQPITDRLNPFDLLPSLIKYGVVLQREAEMVRADELNFGKTRASWLLVSFLPRRVENWFRLFLESLIDCREQDLAKMLDPDLFEKMMIQRTLCIQDASTSSTMSEATCSYEQDMEKDVDNTEANIKPLVDAATQTEELKDLKPHQNSYLFTDMNLAPIELEDLKLGIHAAEAQTQGSIEESAKLYLTKELHMLHGDTTVPPNDNKMTRQDSIEKKKNVENNNDTSTGAIMSGKDECMKSNVEETSLNLVYNRQDHVKEFPESVILGLSPNIVEDSNIDETNMKVIYGCEPENHAQVHPLSVLIQPKSTRGTVKSLTTVADIYHNEGAEEFELEFNIKTDEDDLGDTADTADPDIDLREFQKELAKKGCEGENVIIIAPTNSGKTRVAFKIMQAHFRQMKLNNEIGKVIFIVENEFLANQQGEACAELLENDLSGSPDERIGELEETMDEGSIGNETVEVLDTNTAIKQITDAVDALAIGSAFLRMKIPKQGNAVADIYHYDGEEELEFNIKTDEDDLGDPADPDFDLREYQKELAKEGCEGENVIIIAPTNSGKTRVGFKIMQTHFRQMKLNNEIGKVIFIVENEFLANQQGEACAELLAAYRTKIISGTSQREKKQYLKDFVDKRDILIVTAQILLNSLQQREIESLTKFSMIVFDECHHTNIEHPYNQILIQYLILKLAKDVKHSTLPQIVGLTAVLSTGGNMSQVAATKSMKRVIANLDANFICTVRRNKEELNKYEIPPFEEIVTCEGRTDDIYRQTVVEIMDSIEQLMLTHPCMDNLPQHDQFILNACKLPSCKGTDQFIQWLAEFKKKFVDVKTDEVRRVLNACRVALEIYNRSLLLHKDAQVKDAYSLVVRELQPGVLDAEEEIIDAEIVKLLKDLKEIDFASIPDNPKLIKMTEILVDKFLDDENARCLISVKTRELARALVGWMNETDELGMLNAQEFFGQNASASRWGMTKSTQKDGIDYFKGGRHKVLIATLGDEGLDITKCNLIIRYEHVTNEVVRQQSIGRARAPGSKYLVLTEEGSSWKIEKEEKNAQLEILMNRIIPDLQQYLDHRQNDWHAEMRGIQMMTKIEAERKWARRGPFKTDQYAELQCLNCSSYICMSSDIKKILGFNHVIVDNTVEERVLKFGGVFFCKGKRCGGYTLGGVIEYKSCEFHLVNIWNFKVVYQNSRAENHKKWTNCRFKVETFTHDDLREIVEELKK